jgi:hypothetical protein
MEFSHVPLPEKLCRYFPYVVGDTEDGTTCIVSVSAKTAGLDIRVWFLKGDKWEEQRRVDAPNMLGADRISAAKVCNVTAGVVLLSTGNKHKGLGYVAFRIKNTPGEGGTKLAEFFTSAGWVHPYFMAWPRPSLKVP